MDKLIKFNQYNRKYTMVSLFAGAGGLDIGFDKNGFDILWANDFDADSCATHRMWSSADVIHGDIGGIDMSSIPSSDIITGGFPCQGFSLAGPRKIDDSRNKLYKHFVDLVDQKQPLAFVAENVKGILTLGNGCVLDAILEDFSTRGYNVFPHLVNAADYSVPQDRWRVIMLGFRKDLSVEDYVFPEKHKQRVSLRQAILHMGDPNPKDVCQANYSSRYMSRNRKRSWNDVSYTIPAMSKQVTLHPSSPDMVKVDTDNWHFGKGKTRRFSWQEAAAVQAFPEGMVFEGSLTSKYKQIGNAVPVKLSEVVAKSVYEQLDLALSIKSVQKMRG